MKRADKWRYKRVQLDAEKQRFATMLLNASEELMQVHSDLNRKAFDEMMGNPIEHLEKIWEIRR